MGGAVEAAPSASASDSPGAGVGDGAGDRVGSGAFAAQSSPKIRMRSGRSGRRRFLPRRRVVRRVRLPLLVRATFFALSVRLDFLACLCVALLARFLCLHAATFCWCERLTRLARGAGWSSSSTAMSRRRDTEEDWAGCNDLKDDNVGDADRVGRADDVVFSDDDADDGNGDGSTTRPRIDRSV